MPHDLKIPNIEYYISWLGNLNYRDSDIDFTYDQQSYKDIDEIFNLLEQIKPTATGRTWELWIPAQRGTIEDFGNFEECRDAAEVDTPEEFEELWRTCYPKTADWYAFKAYADMKIPYRAIQIRHHLCIQVDDRRPKNGHEHDISPFTGWLLQSVKDCIQKLKDGTYMESLPELPPQYRFGTITRGDYWKVYPDRKRAYLRELTQNDIDEFISIARKLPGIPRERLPTMTANDFYRFCSIGYAANKYSGIHLTPEHQYYRHADGRVMGLDEINPDSPEEFRAWFEVKANWGHPWEVCAGGTHNHIDLSVQLDARGYYLRLAGSAWDRTIETVRFFLALYRAGVPIALHEAKILASRLEGTEKIGIVPEGVYLFYCRSMFRRKKIIDFMHLPEEHRDELLPFCQWWPLQEIKLIQKRKKKNYPNTAEQCNDSCNDDMESSAMN